MKKNLFLTGLILIAGISAFSQNKAAIPVSLAGKSVQKMKPISGNETNLNFNQQNNSAPKFKKATPVFPTSINETTVGTTFYDLQTNGSIGHRLLQHSNGNISAVWTFSNTNQSGWPDRGTGYNFFDGTSWDPAPTQRIEDIRTGWPEVGVTTGGREVIVCHDPANNQLMKDDRTAFGTGAWTKLDLAAVKPIAVWPRMVVGGSNGQTVHVIGLTSPTAFGGEVDPVTGLDGSLKYARSVDGGDSWDIAPTHLPGMDLTNFDVGMGGDDYSIASKGDIVVVAVADLGQEVMLWKSLDNGTTWTMRKLWDNGYGKFVETSTTIACPATGVAPDSTLDAKLTGDGSCHVLIDDNNVVHVFFGEIYFCNDDLTDGNMSIFLASINGLGYWNETMGSLRPVTIGGTLDLDGSGTLFDDGLYLPRYNNTNYLSSYPSASVDANGCIYLTYCGATEYSNGQEYYRHVYGMYSCDGGCTWSWPTDFTPGSTSTPPGSHDFDDCTFPSTALMTTDSVYILYQKNDNPGTYVGEANSTEADDPDGADDITLCDIVMLSVPKADYDPTTAFCFGWMNDVTSTEFCTGDSVMLSASCGTSYQWKLGGTNIAGATNAVHYATAFGDYSVDITTPCGVITSDTITLSAPTTAPVVTITATPSVACSGDPVVLTTNNVTSGSWLWSTGDATQTITVNDTGTYSVTVTNCGGTTTQTVYVGLPAATVATITASATTICPGDSAQLTANSGNGITYLWSTGESTQTITVIDTGTYSVTITDCVGSDDESVAISFTPAPVASVTNLGSTTFCEGGNVGLQASGAGAGGSYVWSPGGQTTTSITVTQSGAYSVTATNVCGDSDVSNIVNVTVNPLPPVPTVTFSTDANGDITFTSTAASGNQWQNNGTNIAGAVNTTYIVNWQAIAGDSISVVVTDGNGCSSESVPVVAVEVNVKQLAITSSVNIYPNPNNGMFALDFKNVPSDKYNVNIKNVLGQTIYTGKIQVSGNYRFNINISESGIYFLTIANSESEVIKKVVVK